MTSIYDNATLEQLRQQIRDAEATAERCTESAAAAVRARREAQQWAALLAHAEGRQADHHEITQEERLRAAHAAALDVARHLLGTDLPIPASWDMGGHDGQLKIYAGHYALTREQALDRLARWAKHLGGEVTGKPHNDNTTCYKVAVTYMGVQVEVWDLLPDAPPADPAPAENAEDEATEDARAVA